MKSALIVLPVLNDESSLSILVQQLSEWLAGRSDVSLLVVDDGSTPPLDPARLWPDACPFPGRVATLTRNVGHQKAIAIGVAYAVSHSLAEIIVVMDADGEDAPSDVPRLLAAVETAGNFSVAVGKRVKRSENLTFRFFYQVYRLVFRTLTGRSISFGNFSAMPISAARRLVNMSELWLNFPATVLYSKLPLVELPVERRHRYRDQSRMNFVALVILGFGGVSAFLESVLARTVLMVSALIVFCVAASGVATLFKFIGLATPGWVTTVIGTSLVLLVALAILSFLGLVLSMLAGPHTVQPPAALFQSFIAQVTGFESKASAAVRESSSSGPS